MIMYAMARIIKRLQIAAIKNSTIDKHSKIEASSQIVNTKMEKYSYCGYNCKLLNCEIGAFCSISDNVIIGGAQHEYRWISTSPVFFHGRDSIEKKFSDFCRSKDLTTSIGNDVWIGEGAMIKGGVCIGDGAVIGMGSVVTKDVGDYEIWAGNPAHKIGVRFSDDKIDKLRRIKWWNFSEEKIARLAEYICNPEKFISEALEEVNSNGQV